jgi:circadian clock protein KaiC
LKRELSVVSSHSIKSNVERTPFGIPKLDEIIGGGLPKGGITVIAGGPGTGKTVLAAQYLYNGAVKYNEKGLYVIFGETAETFRKYMSSLGWDFQKLESESKTYLMDLATMEKETVGTTLDMILEKIKTFEAKRVVIDSVTALTLTLRDKAEARVTVSLIQRFLRRSNCTTLLITETPWGSNGIGNGVEEFIADGIVLLTTIVGKQQLKTVLTIPKMRATDHDKRRYQLAISNDGGINLTHYVEEAG